MRKRKKEAGTATAAPAPAIGNKGDVVTATTTNDRDHHKGRNVAASHAETLLRATSPIAIAATNGRSLGGKQRRGRNRSYETPTSPVVT